MRCFFDREPVSAEILLPGNSGNQAKTYDILHTFYWPLPHSVSGVFDLNWSHPRLVSTNQKVMSGHFPVFRVEYESPKPYALRVHFKRHMTESRFYTVKSNRSSHKAKKP